MTTSVTATLVWDNVPEEDVAFFRVERLIDGKWNAIGDVNDNNANSLSISIQGNLLNICSDIGIKSVKVYALSGSTLAHFTCNGTETHVSMPSTMGKGIYVVSVETKQGISSRKLVVR